MEYEQTYHEKIHNNLLKDENYYKLRARVAFKRFFSWIAGIKEKKVLEFGCGLGQNIFALKDCEAYGYDISKSALDFSKSKGIKVFSSEKQIKDNSFDVILSSHNLEHMPNPFENLKFINQKLKKSGFLILIIPRETHKKSPFTPDLTNYHLFSWNFRSINNLLNMAGFEIIKNKVLFGTGYKKLSFISKFSFNLYMFLVYLAGLLSNKGDLFIVAKK